MTKVKEITKVKEMTKVRMAMIGLGARGIGLLDTAYLEHDGVEFTAVCDVYEDRVKEAADLIEKRTGARPAEYTDYKEILKLPEVEAVVLCTSWDNHINICIEAMEAGKYVGCEVGGAYSLQECWKLVEAYERTGTPVMLLENCVYGRDEMMVYHMAKQGVLGKIVHCQGGYRHDLREEIAFGREKRHYRLDNYLHRNAENYPTHELGPIARVLDINRGNRMLTLTSVASKAVGLKEYIREYKSDDEALREAEFNQGDVVTTIIKCANGETIVLTLDTTLPRFYSRGFTVQGTKGMYTEENQSIFLDSEHREADHFKWEKQWGNVKDYRDRYEHPVWKKYLSEGVKKGHDGMDYLVFSDYVDCVRNKTQAGIDVYDMVSWMCITALSEQSISLGGQPVAIPDFTNGKWMTKRD